MGEGEHVVVLLYSTSHAVRAEKLLTDHEIPCKLVPIPRHLSSDCSVCVRVAYEHEEAVRAILDESGMDVEGIHPV